MSQMRRLRGHHLICLQFFAGQGYSFDFVQNLRAVVADASAEPAIFAEGADDVCAACPGLSADGTCLDPKAGETEVRRLDRLTAVVLGAAPGARVSLPEARELLRANAQGARRWRAEACHGCTWEELCAPSFDELLGE